MPAEVGKDGPTYTIKPGDNLSTIAEANNTTIKDLAMVNNISNPDQIQAGKQITLQAPSKGGGHGGIDSTATDTSATASISSALSSASSKGGGHGGIDSTACNASSARNDSSGSSNSHIIQTGETLSGIAAEHGTSVSALASSNNISNPDHIRAGDTISIMGGDYSHYSSATSHDYPG